MSRINLQKATIKHEGVEVKASTLNFGDKFADHYEMSENGTNYSILAIWLPDGIVSGYMCLDKNAVLIIATYEKSAYSFSLYSYLAPEYVYEKLCRLGSITDAKSLTKLINLARERIKNELEENL